ncbi:MAG: Na+/H+ antiporter subunit E [Gammaproteobacteria bacterium]|nr:Na+/H+ antiporter subunit E [Gammaproteobacteria bacterium]
MKNTLTLSVLLALFWLALSGHYVAFTLIPGILSIALIVWLNKKMDITDKHTMPAKLLKRLPNYWRWLFVEIIKSNLHVVKKVWQPKLAIEPQFCKVPAPFKTDMIKVIYANSITLTPGTVTVAIEDNELLVHALTNQTLEGLNEPQMKKKLLTLEKEL